MAAASASVVIVKNKSNAAVNTATLSLTTDYCGSKLKYLHTLAEYESQSNALAP